MKYLNDKIRIARNIYKEKQENSVNILLSIILMKSIKKKD